MLLVLQVSLFQIAQELHQLLLLDLGLAFPLGRAIRSVLLLCQTTLSLGFLDFVVLEAVGLLLLLGRVGQRLFLLLKGLSLQLGEEGGLGVDGAVDLSRLLQQQSLLEGV